MKQKHLLGVLQIISHKRYQEIKSCKNYFHAHPKTAILIYISKLLSHPFYLSQHKVKTETGVCKLLKNPA